MKKNGKKLSYDITHNFFHYNITKLSNQNQLHQITNKFKFT